MIRPAHSLRILALFALLPLLLALPATGKVLDSSASRTDPLAGLPAPSGIAEGNAHRVLAKSDAKKKKKKKNKKREKAARDEVERTSAPPSTPEQGESDAPETNGSNVSRVAYKQGEFVQVADRSWEQRTKSETPVRLNEADRDDWSVYLHDPVRDIRFQLDLHRKRIRSAPRGQPYDDLYEISAFDSAGPSQTASASEGAATGASQPTTTAQATKTAQKKPKNRKAGKRKQKKGTTTAAPQPSASTNEERETPQLPKATGENADRVRYTRGEFVQTGDRVWENRVPSRSPVRLEETQRDAASVYLRDPAKETRYQLDLQAKVVRYAGQGQALKNLYDIVEASAPPEKAATATPGEGAKKPTRTSTRPSPAATPAESPKKPTRTSTRPSPASTPGEGPKKPTRSSTRPSSADTPPIPPRPAERPSAATPPPPPRPAPKPISIEAEGCGNAGQRPCTITTAEFVGKGGGCPAGSRAYPLHEGGTCWACPSGSNHVAIALDGPSCEIPAGLRYSKATRHKRGTSFLGAGTDCPPGQSWDPNGWCYSCQSGFSPNFPVPAKVTAANACKQPVRAKVFRAERTGSLFCSGGAVFDPINGGTCWRCPDGFGRSLSSVKAADACASTAFAGLGDFAGTCAPGHRNIRGSCQANGDCGGRGQRPCEIDERVPSCHEGLKENFKQNVCQPLRPGETAFFGGLSSLAEFYGDGIREACKAAIGSIRFTEQTPLAVGANCTKDLFTGATCEILAAQLGAGTADMANSFLETGPTAAAFKSEVDTAYGASPCTDFAEKLAPAQRHGRANGLKCPSGRFWDPNGNCYSCPSGYTRTAYRVDSPYACVDKPAGELIRSACSVAMAAANSATKGAECTIEVFQSGVLTNEPIDFSRASPEFCMAAGEMAVAVADIVVRRTSPQKKQEKLTSALDRFISTAKGADSIRGDVTTVAATTESALSGLAACQ